MRTERYTYVRTLGEPWLLYDNQTDPNQLENLTNREDVAEVQKQMERTLDELLSRYNDDFLGGEDYMSAWGYQGDETGTPPYS